jgi:glycosyltransferase involved in cell wall biosynthesis
MKVLLIAHSISPLRGSEPGLGWNWASFLSRHHEIWVISHPEFRTEVDEHLARHPNPNLHILWLRGSNWNPAKGPQGIAFHYVKWLRQAERLAKELKARISFDIVHHVSFASVSVPSRLWQLGTPFVWGPLGGAQTCPGSLISLFGSDQLYEHMRTLRVKLLPYFPSLRKAVKEASVLLATNYETQRMLLAAGGRDVPLFWDNGIPDDMLPAGPEIRAASSTVKVLWASKLEKRKALPLALQAISLVDRRLPVELVVAGDGPQREESLKRAAELGVNDRVRFLGHMRPTEMQQQFKAADIFLFTSVRDSCASVVLEAMAHALPVITLDLHGVGAYMPAAAGIKIPVTNVDRVAQELAHSIRELALNDKLRREKGIEGWKYSRQRQWSARAKMMTDIYQNCTVTT